MSAVTVWDVEERRRPSPPRLTVVPPPAPSGRLRLTRRGRLVLGLAPVVLVLAALAGAAAVAAPAPTAPPTVVVQPGQTLSEVAATQLSDVPVQEGVVRLQLANRLSSLHVHAGQSLVIPR